MGTQPEVLFNLSRSAMLPFIRSDLAQLTAYKSHPEIEGNTPADAQVDRLDTNESPFDLPDELETSTGLDLPTGD